MKREIKLLKFSNPVFNDGINVTVRHGTKWLGVSSAVIDLGGNFTTSPTALHTRSIAFNKLTDADVANEHDPSCRTVAGLAAEMKMVYPEFIETDIVTLATFLLRYRKPVEGDHVYLPDMVPYFAGAIEDVVELNDDFYEIMFEGKRAIVHASQYQFDLFQNEDGWVVVTTY